MTIVLLITMGIDRPSGTRYFSLARQWTLRGHRVRILALHPDLRRCPRRRFVQDGVEVWYVGQMYSRKSDSVPQRFGPLELLRVLIASTAGMVWGTLCSPADVYHLGKPQPVNGLAAVLALHLRGRRFWVDCDDDEVGANRFGAAWQSRVFAFWQALLPRLASGVTVNTRFLQHRLAAADARGPAYVPNGVDRQRFRRPEEPVLRALRGALGLEGRRVIGYAGSLALHNHPVDLLLDAFAMLAGERDDLDLLLIGGGEDLPELRRRAAVRGWRNRVHFTGRVAPRAVAALLSLAEVSVDPVRDDDVARARSPLKIVESLALGVPVVTGDVGDRREVVGAAGMTTTPGDAPALARTLERMLDDRVAREAAAAAAPEQASRYGWSRLADDWLAAYNATHPLLPRGKSG